MPIRHSDPAALTGQIQGDLLEVPRREYKLLKSLLETAGKVLP